MDREEYLAHIADDGRKQTILEHLQGVAELSAQFAAEFGAGEQGRTAGFSHDIGKYSQEFQRRLHGGPRVDHATAGAFELMKRNSPYAAFCVAGHHGGLPDLGGRGDSDQEPTLMGRCKRGAAGKLPDYSAFRTELTLPDGGKLPDFCEKDSLTDAFFTRMLFSCLTDADFLDTERFMTGARESNAVGMEELAGRLDSHVKSWFPPKTPLNRRRCEILTACTEAGDLPPGLFTLTVPTGGGKTVASLAFALHHACARGKKRIIYVIPYTSIIEQTASVFRDILGEDAVLEHHSGVQYDVGEFAAPESIRLARATENWDMPVIVTTAVQFFESLYSSRPSRCRKLHNLADSVIIFDEAQMLPLNYLRPCVHAIAQLIWHYGATAVLCTATQPALEGLFAEFLPGRRAVELCPPGVCGDEVFRRVCFRWAGVMKRDELCAALSEENQVLCIVNSRKSAAEVYAGLPEEGSFHLSTLMVPAHRKEVLEEIRRRLRAGETCRVVATSLIEAGVDVDFPKVFREEAGLDSILQAAGRCNREGRRSPEESIVTIFRGENPPPPLFSAAIGAARTVMEQSGFIASTDAIHAYFTEWMDLKGAKAQDKKDILKQTASFPFRAISEEFHLIENDTKTVYIPVGAGQALAERYRRGERSRELFRALGQYSVSVYSEHFSALLEAGDLIQADEETAILDNLTLYSGQTGLSTEADFGKALFG